MDRFQASHEGSVHEQLLNIRQEGSVREYVDRFESLAGQLLDLSEKVLESTFVKGLKPDTRAAIRVAEPESLAQAMRMAIKIDENKPAGNGRVSSNTLRWGGGGGVRTPAVIATDGGDKKNTGEPGGTFKRLTSAELADKRARGICFRCDGKFAPGHRCPNKTLQVLVVDEEEGDQGDDEDEEADHAHLDAVEVSLGSISGLTSPTTMKVRCEVRGAAAVVLIDCGATHNFISKQIVDRLGLEVTGKGLVRIKLGNGITDVSKGRCKGIGLKFPELQVTQYFFPLDLGGPDLILGMAWLQTLGDMAVNWKELYMRFWAEGRWVTIRGDRVYHDLEPHARPFASCCNRRWKATWCTWGSANEAPIYPTRYRQQYRPSSRHSRTCSRCPPGYLPKGATSTRLF